MESTATKLNKFLGDDTGAVTIDWVALPGTAAGAVGWVKPTNAGDVCAKRGGLAPTLRLAGQAGGAAGRAVGRVLTRQLAGRVLTRQLAGWRWRNKFRPTPRRGRTSAPPLPGPGTP